MTPIWHSHISDSKTFFQWLEATTCGKPETRLFRGLQNDNYALIPSVGRIKNYTRVIEERYLSEFRRTAVPHLARGEETKNWILWCIAQHHGVRTRLMDWTRSPLVAAYFAVDYDCETVDETVNAKICSFPASGKWKPKFVDVGGEKGNPLELGTCVVLPPHADARIIAQSGMFTICDPPTDQFTPEGLHEVVIDKKYKRQLRCLLHRLGVNRATLFPDLDGIATHLKWLEENALDGFERDP